MKVFDCYPLKFHDIPKQDNAAFGDTPGLMIVGEVNGSGHAVVLQINPKDPHEAVTSIASFWRHGRALDYANRLCSKRNPCRVCSKMFTVEIENQRRCVRCILQIGDSDD